MSLYKTYWVIILFWNLNTLLASHVLTTLVRGFYLQPTLYWSCNDANHPTQVIVGSEPLSDKNWTAFADHNTLFVPAESLQPITSRLAIAC
ncbi:hypothetical protein F7734_59880 [Scytonema sp. UIC 10036]|uniref:hypothetical protein n=1 Tax=Scytonema sp. UIC 10036 TaxID=2304196 RepID=UPI0012DA5200|nr:hypothetical protein [Scytonema sp. UIC 10036]MUH01788.1 hypothetical protein [Scytonema sp. UIC 10036]